MARFTQAVRDVLLDMARQGHTTRTIAEALDVNQKSVLLCIRTAGLPAPGRGSAQPVQDGPRMPEGDLASREDFLDIVAALQRCRGSAVGVAQIAARCRLPYAVLHGLAARVLT